MKKVICVDCGEEFEVVSKGGRRTRCDNCYEKHRRESYKISKRKTRSLAMSTEQNQ